jgi:hypothetical protein
VVADARFTHCKPNGDPITIRERLAWIILEGYAWEKPYCRLGIDSFAAALGCERRNAFEILAEMDGDRLIHRVFDDNGKLIGIILLARTNPDRYTPKAEEIPGLIRRLKEEREAYFRSKQTPATSHKPARKTAQDPCGKPHESRAENRAFETSLSLEANASGSDSGPDLRESSERQRPEPPVQPTPVAPATVADVPAAPAVEAAAVAPDLAELEHQADAGELAPVEVPASTPAVEARPRRSCSRLAGRAKRAT